VLSLYRALIALRRRSPALLHGQIRRVAADGDVLSYERNSETQQVAVFLNLGVTARNIHTPAGKILLSTHGRSEMVAGETILSGSEAIIVAVETSGDS
jgi:alpha-glucosidase